MTYTTTLHNGQLTLPAPLLHEAGLTADAPVTVRSGNGGLVIEPVALELTIEEAEARFPAEWIFMAVTYSDSQGLASGGRIIAHAPEHDAVAEQAHHWIEAHPGQPNALFFSGEPQGIIIV